MLEDNHYQEVIIHYIGILLIRHSTDLYDYYHTRLKSLRLILNTLLKSAIDVVIFKKWI